MNPYVVMLRRDIYKDPWLTLVLLILLYVKLVNVEVSLDWHLVFILYVSLYPMRLQAFQGSASRMLLPNENKLDFNYAMGMVILLAFLFSVFGTSSLLSSIVTFSVCILSVSIITLLNLYLKNKLIEFTMQILLILSLIAGASYLDKVVSQYSFDFELSTELIFLLCVMALLVSACITFVTYRIVRTKRELDRHKKNLDLTVFDINISKKMIKNKEKQPTDVSFFELIKNKFLEMIHSIFTIWVFDKSLNRSLYPIGTVNSANGAILSGFIGIFTSRLLALDPPTSSHGLVDLLWLLFLACNIIFCFDFISNKKMMAGLWLRFKSQSRTHYMNRLVWLLVSRHASSLLPCLLILGLVVTIFKGEINFNQELLVFFVGCYFSWLLQLSFILYITPKVELTRLNNVGVFIASLLIFVASQFLADTFVGLIILCILTSLCLAWNVFQWRNTQLELV